MRETGLTSQQGRVTIPEAGRLEKGEKKGKKMDTQSQKHLKKLPHHQNNQPKKPEVTSGTWEFDQGGVWQTWRLQLSSRGTLLRGQYPTAQGDYFLVKLFSISVYKLHSLVQQQKNHQDQLHLSSTDKLPN